MAARLPLVRIAGRFRQLPSGDYVPATAGGTGVGSLAELKTALSLDKVVNTADADKPISTAEQAALDLKAPTTRPALLGPVTIGLADTSSGDTALSVNAELANTAAINIPQSFGLNFTDKSKSSRLSAQLFRLIYTRDATATGSPTAFDALAVLTPVINQNAAFPVRGLVMEGPAVAAGTTLQSWTAARIQAPSGSGVVTSKIALQVDANAGSSLFGTASDNGRDIVQASGSISATGPLKLGQYTLTTLPSAATYNGYLIDVSNATGGPKTCRSNGSVWQILNTTNTVN